MYGNYNKNLDYSTSSNDNVFNVSGQNIMSNNKSIDAILNENKKLKFEINKKNKEIEIAKKRLDMLEKEIAQYRKQKNNNPAKNRGRSVGMRNNVNLNNNNDYGFGFNVGMFNENDPFNDPFFNFQ